MFYSLPVPSVLRLELLKPKLLYVMASAFWPYLAAFRAEHDACERELLDMFLAGVPCPLTGACLMLCLPLLR